MKEMKSVINRHLCLGCEICCPSACPEILTIIKNRITPPGQQSVPEEMERVKTPAYKK